MEGTGAGAATRESAGESPLSRKLLEMQEATSRDEAPRARPAAPVAWRPVVAGPPAGMVPLRAVGLGLLAAVAGALAWGLLAKAAGIEIGFLAVGIGLAVGVAILWGAGRRTGLPLQATGIVLSVLGFLGGKFFWVYLEMRDYLGTLPPEEQGADGFLLTMSLLRTFVTEPGLWFTLYDALWIGLAAVAAWRVLRGPKVAPRRA